MAEQEYLLQMQGISKQFSGVYALNKVSLNIRPGTVHALMGENGAGKSTLMKCLFGIYKKDEGSIILDGKPVDFANPHAALLGGISMVHQELEQVQEQSVADNVWLGRYETKAGFIDDRKMAAETKKLLGQLGLEVDPRIKLSKLTVSQRQMIDIAKAVSYQCRVVVLDEPTSSLTEREVKHLFEIIRDLKAKGISIIYISHKMEEIYAIADDISVMRDGHMIGTRRVDSITMDEVIAMMVGRKLENRFPPKENRIGDVVLRLKNCSEDRENSIENINLELHRGEILGLAGLLGAGRTELLELIFGLRKRREGTIELNGREVKNRTAKEAIANGFALCTEERRYNGIFPGLSLNFNAVMPGISRYKNKLGALNDRKIVKDTAWVMENLKVKAASQDMSIHFLSGGNQQKVILGRWLLLDPEILLMDDPTRGIDVGAKYDIYQLILDFAKKGKSVIVASSEMPELLGICDRILVLSGGRITGEFGREEATQEEIFKAAAVNL